MSTSLQGKRKLMGVVDDGNPPLRARLKETKAEPQLSGEVATMVFKIHDFPDRTESSGNCITTKSIKSHGCKWYLRVYPRGCSESDENTEYVSVYLVSSDSAKVKYAITIGSKTNKDEKGFRGDVGRGWTKFLKRADVLNTTKNYLDKYGTMKIVVELDVYGAKKSIWYPARSPLEPNKTLLVMYNQDELKDARFLVGRHEFRVHKCLLAARAPVLYDLVKDEPTDEEGILLEPVEVTDIQWLMFEKFLRCLYAELPPRYFTGSYRIAEEMYLAADRFGATDLKLFFESILCDHCLTVTTAAELLLVAHGHNSPLLKEQAMKICIEEMASVQKTKDWSLVKESNELLSELLAVKISSVKDDGRSNGNFLSDYTNFDEMDVTTLREKLEKAELDLDGNREMLVQRLKQYESDSELLFQPRKKQPKSSMEN